VGGQALYIVNSDGSGRLHQITPWRLDGGGAAWSSDGRWIVFRSYRNCCQPGASQVWVVHPDGSGLRRLTRDGRNVEPE
jgi:Tol biopolymer transport system component